MRRILLFVSIFTLTAPGTSGAESWPQWGGPDRDFTAAPAAIAAWGDRGPERLVPVEIRRRTEPQNVDRTPEQPRQAHAPPREQLTLVPCLGIAHRPSMPELALGRQLPGSCRIIPAIPPVPLPATLAPPVSRRRQSRYQATDDATCGATSDFDTGRGDPPRAQLQEPDAGATSRERSWTACWGGGERRPGSVGRRRHGVGPGGAGKRAGAGDDD